MEVTTCFRTVAVVGVVFIGKRLSCFASPNNPPIDKTASSWSRLWPALQGRMANVG